MDVTFQYKKKNNIFLMDSLAHCTDIELMCILNGQPIDMEFDFENLDDNNKEKEE